MPALADSTSYKPEELYFRSVYVVAEGDKIGDLADIFNIAPYNLKVWNKLTSYQLNKGQELTIWFPTEVHHFFPNEEKIEVLPMAEAVNTTIVETVPEEAFERDNLPVPGEMPIANSIVKAKSESLQALKVVTTPPSTVKSQTSNKMDKITSPLKKIKATSPKPKEKPASPKEAPVLPKRKVEPTGHGII